MSNLNREASRALREAGITKTAWARHFFADPSEWHGDACGCADDRCIGYHHDENDDCGCLPVLIQQFLAEQAGTGP
ncbi:hypothetical protein NUM3379_35070 [Kineococcus sp. NUM-3379]